jgi:hypothetical protein
MFILSLVRTWGILYSIHWGYNSYILFSTFQKCFRRNTLNYSYVKIGHFKKQRTAATAGVARKIKSIRSKIGEYPNNKTDDTQIKSISVNSAIIIHMKRKNGL